MPKKEYSLLSTEPLTEFDDVLLRVLKEMRANADRRRKEPKRHTLAQR